MYPYLQQVTDDADGIPVTGPKLFFPKGHCCFEDVYDIVHPEIPTRWCPIDS